MSEQTKIKASVTLYAIFVILLLVSASVYPGDWVVPMPLAALWGPFLGIQLGFADAFLIAILSLGLITPIVIKRTKLRIALLIVGICIWVFTGLACGAVLYA